FHGRDVYAYTAARLAAGKISFDEVGPLLKDSIIHLHYQKPEFRDYKMYGNIPILDIQYGNVWTNVPDSLFNELGARYGDTLDIGVYNLDSSILSISVPYAKTFGDVDQGKPLGYINSLGNFSLAMNMGNFADSFNIKSGKNWRIEMTLRMVVAQFHN
ncbi:MAG TPA: SAM hydroxide adenosyltransferase, partial [Chitinophagaceae bacterium]|nr:SAM hydroxide adenosyltransferase [Chitinophagaceae bacterium]